MKPSSPAATGSGRRQSVPTIRQTGGPLIRGKVMGPFDYYCFAHGRAALDQGDDLLPLARSRWIAKRDVAHRDALTTSSSNWPHVVVQAKLPEERLRFLDLVCLKAALGRNLEAYRQLQPSRRRVLRQHLRVEVHPFLRWDLA